MQGYGIDAKNHSIYKDSWLVTTAMATNDKRPHPSLACTYIMYMYM